MAEPTNDFGSNPRGAYTGSQEFAEILAAISERASAAITDAHSRGYSLYALIDGELVEFPVSCSDYKYS